MNRYKLLVPISGFATTEIEAKDPQEIMDVLEEDNGGMFNVTVNDFDFSELMIVKIDNKTKS